MSGSKVVFCMHANFIDMKEEGINKPICVEIGGILYNMEKNTTSRYCAVTSHSFFTKEMLEKYKDELNYPPSCYQKSPQFEQIIRGMMEFVSRSNTDGLVYWDDDILKKLLDNCKAYAIQNNFPKQICTMKYIVKQANKEIVNLKNPYEAMLNHGTGHPIYEDLYQEASDQSKIVLNMLKHYIVNRHD